MTRFLPAVRGAWNDALERTRDKYTFYTRTLPVYADPKGQISGLLIFFIAIAVIIFYYIVLGPIMYQFTDIQNGLTDNGLVSSQEKMTTMALLQAAFKFMPVICLIIVFIWLIMNALRENSGSI
jgi:hypothetical protein